MTSEEWRTSNDPLAMLRHLWGLSPSDRKLRLFGVACCRQLWRRLEFRSQRCVVVHEALADRPVPELRLTGAVNKAYDHYRRHSQNAAARAAVNLSWNSLSVRSSLESIVVDVNLPAILAELLRTVFGPLVPHGPLDWVTAEVRSVARRAYADRDDYGFIRQSRVGELYTAVLNSGCQDAALMRHAMQPYHVRGSWSIDLILGKE